MPRPRKPRVEIDLAPARDRRPLWESVADSLRDAILSGALHAGANLVEADLADRFNVSRGPIRDALRELAREGLVVDLPRRGTLVSTLTFSDVRDVYAIREGLETVAARLVAERATDEELAELRVHVQDMEDAWDRRAGYGESLAADLAFHRGLVALSANRRLIPLYEQTLSQTQLLVRTAALTNPRIRLAMRRAAHRDIYDALRSRDPDAIRTAIVEHYEYAEQRLFSGMSRRADVPDPSARSGAAGAANKVGDVG